MTEGVVIVMSNITSVVSGSRWLSAVLVTCMLRLFVSEKMESMGYSRKDVEEALMENRYNDIMATYLLLSRKVTVVCRGCFCI